MVEKDYFFKVWEKQLNDVRAILKYLHTYPDLLKEIEAEDLILPEDLIQSQSDWIHLYNQYEGLEKEFFKIHWVPIQKGQYDYFIDISNPNYPLMGHHFNSCKPYKYVNKNLFDSINDLLLLDYKNVDLYMYVQMYGFELING